MRTYSLLFLILVIGSLNAVAQPPLDRRIQHFTLQDGTAVEGLSKLSSLSILGLHLGVEKVLDTDDGPAVVVKFSLALDDVTVRDVLNALCNGDSRYTWNVDGQTINLYPRDTDPNFLTNLQIDHLEFENLKDPYAALELLWRALPKQQVGYAGVGATAKYAQPWSATFNKITVRQYLNRISERVEPSGGWVLSGSRKDRFFSFYPTSFR